MSKIKQKITRIRTTKSTAKEIAEDVKNPIANKSEKNKAVFKYGVVSTGSTLADLAISGNRIRGGGVPCGILMVVSGPKKIGKTAVLEEMTSSVQKQEGFNSYKDPEGRLDKNYAEVYGIDLSKLNYSMPDTVTKLFREIRKEMRDNREEFEGKPNIIVGDSLAALCSEMEWGDDGEGEDKRGQARAKDFSTELRKTCRIIADSGWLIACSNQERDGDRGSINPGGRAIPYYASLHLRLTPVFPISKVVRKKKFKGKDVEKVIGIRAKLEVKDSSIDDPFRTAPIFILWNYGIDDVRANLQWYKDVMSEKSYGTMFDGKFRSMDDAIKHVEENKLQRKLKNIIIDTWEELEKVFDVPRKKKIR